MRLGSLLCGEDIAKENLFDISKDKTVGTLEGSWPMAVLASESD